MTIVKKLFLALLFSLSSSWLAGAEEQEVLEEEQELIEEEDQVISLDTPPDDFSLDGIEDESEQASDENFVPSIRITEDLPVAFPVDI